VLGVRINRVEIIDTAESQTWRSASAGTPP
jgi:hypothetical protein